MWMYLHGCNTMAHICRRWLSFVQGVVSLLGRLVVKGLRLGALNDFV